MSGGKKFESREGHMRLKLLDWAFVLVLFTGFAGVARADDDNRMFGKFDHTGPKDHLQTASVYLTFKGDKADGLPSLPSGEETRLYSKIWDDLFLQITTETGENGVLGYMFTFSTDEEDQKSLTPDEPKSTPTLRELAAADFRTKDNFGPLPLKPGPGTPKDRSALRVIHYDGFDVEIRVLEFSIGDAQLGKKPYFKSLSCLVTVRETEKKKQTK
jgi:hypothetical protein